MLLSDDESKMIWDKVYKQLHFTPSINKNVVPFIINSPFVVYDISNLTDDKIDIMDEVITDIFCKCIEDNECIYALDWQHSDFIFNPLIKEDRSSINVQDLKYMGGGYYAYFPSYYPDGDYYFFIAKDFRFGYLGHPWQQKVWVFGECLIREFEKNVYKLGFDKEN